MSLAAAGARIKRPDLKILTLDIERLPGQARLWSPRTQYVPPRDFLSWPRTTTIAWRWYGQRRIEFAAEWETDHATFIQKTWELYDQADVIYTFNGIRADNPWLKTEWLQLGLKPPLPWKDVDLYREMRAFGFESKSLDSVTKRLGRQGKVDRYDPDLMQAALDGDVKAQKRVKRYNCGDVELTEWLADYCRPWLKTHPFPRSLGDEKQCQNCGSNDLELIQHKKWRAVVLDYPLYRCRDCGKPMRGGWEARAANTRGV